MNAALGHRGPDGKRRLCRSRASLSATPGWRSSMSPAARSRASTKPPAMHWCSTAKSTGIEPSPPSCAASAVPLRDRSDTEVLFQLIRREGVRRAVERIDGMFAFAFRDGATGTLYLVRDRFGEKPLYYGMARREYRLCLRGVGAAVPSGIFGCGAGPGGRVQFPALRIPARNGVGMAGHRQARARHHPHRQGRPHRRSSAIGGRRCSRSAMRSPRGRSGRSAGRAARALRCAIASSPMCRSASFCRAGSIPA